MFKSIEKLFGNCQWFLLIFFLDMILRSLLLWVYLFGRFRWDAWVTLNSPLVYELSFNHHQWMSLINSKRKCLWVFFSFFALIANFWLSFNPSSAVFFINFLKNYDSIYLSKVFLSKHRCHMLELNESFLSS